MDLKILDKNGANSLNDFYLGICFEYLKTIDEKIKFILDNIEVFDIDKHKNILENIILTKDKIRKNTSGFYKTETILMSEIMFEKLKNQQNIDDKVNSLSVTGSKILPKEAIKDNKIIFISNPKNKIDSKLTDKITITEN